MDHPETGHELLRTFVPLHVQRVLAGRGDRQTAPFQTTVNGAVLVADIVGFTALAEGFEIAYNEGAAKLSALLDGLFGFLQGIVASKGGEVVHLAGDGLLAIWPVDEEAELGDAARCCIAAALAIQQGAAEGLAKGSQTIRMRVGVGAGPIWIPVVGGEHGGWFAPSGGQPLGQVAKALDAARPGDVVVAREAVALAGDALIGTATSQGHVRADSIGPAPIPHPPALPLLSESMLESFVPETVASRAAGGMTSRFAEIRQASTIFVKVRGLGTSVGQHLDELQQVTTAFQAAVRRYDGAVAVTLLDETGLSIIGTWGGSGHAHEDDAVRALSAAMAFASAVEGVEVGVGVASGRLYFGDVGAGQLRRFTVLGHPVNLAARLATSVAGAPIRCDAATMAAARRSIAFEEHAPLHLKGMPVPTRTFRPVEAIEYVRGDAFRMVGRSHERDVLSRAFGAFLKGTGAVVLIEGEPGIGKSTLVRDLLRASESHPVRRLVVRGSPLDQSNPYHPWRAVFGSLIGSADVESLLNEVLEPEEREAVGLLAEVIPGVPRGWGRPTDLSPGDRIETTRRILARLLSRLVHDAPLLLVLEDAHWYDTATWALTEAAVAHHPDALVVCVTRGVTAPPDPAELRLRRDAEVLGLHSLTADQTVALACDRLDVPSIPSDLAELIHDRTEGHPLFTEELIRSLTDSGVIAIAGAARELTLDREAIDALALPSSIAGIIVARIDRLPLTHQSTLKAASIAGRSFTIDDIEAIHPDSLSTAEIKDHLEEAVAMGLIASSDQGHAGGYRFSHVLTGEATYGLLPAEVRAPMHLALARSLARRADTPPSILAHHWEAGGDASEAAAAFDEAAKIAVESGADREAIQLLANQHALCVADRSSLATARREAMWGEAYIQLGELERGHHHLLTAAERAGMPMPSTRWRMVWGLLVQIIRQLKHRVITRKPRRAEEAERTEIGSAAYWSMTATTFGRQDALGLLYVGLRATNEAERIPATQTLAQGYSFLAYASGVVGVTRISERYHQRALAAAAAAVSPVAAAEVELNRAVMLTAVGRWHQAAAELTEAAEGFQQVGSRTDRARALSVRAYVHFHCGQFHEAYALWTEIGTTGSDDKLVRAWVASGQARASVRIGRYSDAISILGSNQRLIDEVGELPTRLVRLGFHASALWQEGQLDPAIDSATTGLEAIEGTEAFAAPHAFDGIAEITKVLLAALDFNQDDKSRALAERAVRSIEKVARRLPIARPRASMARAILLSAEGKNASARRRFRRALQQADAMGMPYEHGLILREMGYALDDTEALARSTAEFSTIGAVEDVRPVGVGQRGG